MTCKIIFFKSYNTVLCDKNRAGTLTWRVWRDGVAVVTASTSGLGAVRRTVAVFTMTLSQTVALLHTD